MGKAEKIRALQAQLIFRPARAMGAKKGVDLRRSKGPKGDLNSDGAKKQFKVSMHILRFVAKNARENIERDQRRKNWLPD